LGVALGFVGNYAPCGLSPQTDGMPVVQLKKIAEPASFSFFVKLIYLIHYLCRYSSMFW